MKTDNTHLKAEIEINRNAITQFRNGLYEIHSEISDKPIPENTEKIVKSILIQIHALKAQINQFKIFRSQLVKTLELKKDTNEDDILNYSKTVPYFTNLFDIRDNLIESIHAIYLNLRNYESFVVFVKRFLNLDSKIATSDVLDILRGKLYDQ